MTKKFTLIGFFLLLALTLFSTLFLAQSTFANSDRVLLMAQVGETLDDPNFSFDLNSITNQGVTGTIKQRWIRGGVNYFFGRVIGFLAGVIGGLCVLMISYGGFLILSSAGNEEQYQKGIDYIKFSAIGLVAVLSAYILVNAVQLLIHSIYA